MLMGFFLVDCGIGTVTTTESFPTAVANYAVLRWHAEWYCFSSGHNYSIHEHCDSLFTSG